MGTRVRQDGQLNGMRGVYAVAAELSKRGYIASTTSRGAQGADILATDRECQRAMSVQVKADRRGTFWLLNKALVSPSHYYVFVRFRGEDEVEYYPVPSKLVEEVHVKPPNGWANVRRADIEKYKDRWDVFED